MLAKTKPLHSSWAKENDITRSHTNNRQQRAYLISLRRLMFTALERPNSPRFRIRPTSHSNDMVTHGIRQPFISRPTLRVTDTIPRYRVNSRAWNPLETPLECIVKPRGFHEIEREVYRLQHCAGLSENWRTLERERETWLLLDEFLRVAADWLAGALIGLQRGLDWLLRWFWRGGGRVWRRLIILWTGVLD